VLLGDACHPTLPYQAQGAALAVEDGAVLGWLLGETSKRLTQEAELNASDRIQGVLKLYESLRKVRTTTNVQGAIANRMMYHLPDGPDQVKRDKELLDFDYDHGRSDIKWADTEYQKDMLGFDAIGDTKQAFGKWWNSREA